jgi:hypothetical protein
MSYDRGPERGIVSCPRALHLRRPEAFYCYEVTVAASADDAKSTLEGAYGIWAPKVAGHSAENLRNTGSALRAR